MRFTKMQGIGNDYIYLDCVRHPMPADPPALSRRISDRHFGVGSDGLVLICPSDKADFRMRMYNADGSESEMCGNATRCIAKYVYERGLTDKTEITLETGAGIKILRLHLEAGKVDSVTVDMGEPILRPADIPMDLSKAETPLSPDRPAVNFPLTVGDQPFRATAVSMGNPHCVIFRAPGESLAPETWGPRCEVHPLFPRRVNTEFASVEDRTHIRMRVWERGSGETLACGTGACATLVAAVLCGLTDREATLHLLGGDLRIRWDEETNRVLMTGPAAFVFDGDFIEE